MPNYNEAQGVADLLSKFDFNIISEGPGDFSTQHREEARSDEGRVTLKDEAQASRAASEKLAEGRDTGSPAREDPSIV